VRLSSIANFDSKQIFRLVLTSHISSSSRFDSQITVGLERSTSQTQLRGHRLLPRSASLRMPSTNRPTRSTRQTRTTRQASSIADEDVHATPKKATRKRAAPNAIASSARSNPQTPVPSSTATKVGSATPRGLISSPANQRRIKGGSIPEESLSQPAPSMEESMEESMVREPAKIALGEMLSDVDSGLPLTAAQKKAYETFESEFSLFHESRSLADEAICQCLAEAKSRQFKTSDFLDRHTLPDQYRSALSVSTSTFASLIKLANLTSFVHLVLSSAPDPQTKKRSAESAENLKKASLQLMKTVVPETDQIDERIIRLVVDLKCQVSTVYSSISLLESERVSRSDRPTLLPVPTPLFPPSTSSRTRYDPTAPAMIPRFRSISAPSSQR